MSMTIETILSGVDRERMATIKHRRTTNMETTNFQGKEGGFSNFSTRRGGGIISYFVSANAWFCTISNPLQTFLGWLGSSWAVDSDTGNRASITNVFCDIYLLLAFVFLVFFVFFAFLVFMVLRLPPSFGPIVAL